MQFGNWWLELCESDFQRLFPFMTQDDSPNIDKIKRYKSKDNYIAAMSKGGKKTEKSAETILTYPANNWQLGQEELVELKPSAIRVPAFTFPNGRERPAFNIAVAYLQSTNSVNPDVPQYNKRRYRILAYYQGNRPTFNKEEVFDGYSQPIGGLMGMGGYITHVWVSQEFRGDNSERAGLPNLYKELLSFAKQRGIVGLMPEDATCPNCGTSVNIQYEPKKCPKCGTTVSPLTSKSFRASQAKYDWKRAWETLGKNPPD